MTHHSQDVDPHRLRDLDPRMFGFEGDRVMHHKSLTRELRASDLYEDLRKLSNEELAKIAGVRDARQCMIAELILRAIEGGPYAKRT